MQMKQRRGFAVAFPAANTEPLSIRVNVANSCPLLHGQWMTKVTDALEWSPVVPGWLAIYSNLSVKAKAQTLGSF